MIELRPYQKIAINEALVYFRTGSHALKPILVAPTAAGKSIYVAHIADELGEDVLVLQPSKELLEQNYKKFKMYGGNASIYSASFQSKEIGAVTFAMIKSIKNYEDFAHIKYVIIDECHRVPPKKNSEYVKFLNTIPKAKVLGLTATAFRLKNYRDPWSGAPFSKINLLPREKPKFFNDFLHITQIHELYEQGFLSPIVYAEMVWDNGQLKVNSTGADYTEDSVDRAIKQQMVIERIPSLVLKALSKGRKHCLVFVKDIEQANELSRTVPKSASVSSETKPKDREKLLDDFKSGKIKVMFNVGVLTEGFDFPELDTIVIARPTMSLSLYMQMIGRGIRLHPDKKDCVVVDLCGNIERFGKIEDIKYVATPTGYVLKSGEKVLSGVRM